MKKTNITMINAIEEVKKEMKNLYNFKIAGYCETDKNASKAYSAIHNVPGTINLRDVAKLNMDKLPYVNVLAGGSPCQDFSKSGKKNGAVWTCLKCGETYNPLEVHYTQRRFCPHCHSKKIEKTRSSLLVHYLEVLHYTMPNFAIYENVKNLLSKRFKPLFDMFVAEVEAYGYNVYYKVLNAKDYGIPQNRERVILIAVRKELDNGRFKFPEPVRNGKTINDLLDDCSGLFSNTDKNVLVDTAISPYVRKNIERELDDIIRSPKSIYRPNCTSGWNDNQVGIKYSPSLRASNSNTIVMQTTDTPTGKKYYIKRLSPCEAYRFMGFDDRDCENASSVCPKTAIYHQAGNSIVVDVVYWVLKELFNSMPYLFENIRFLHLFSGIGAFEKAFYRVIDEANSTALKGGDLLE